MEKRKPEIAEKKELEESRKENPWTEEARKNLERLYRRLGDMCDVTKRLGEAIEDTKKLEISLENMVRQHLNT